ncbi:MAG: hypothetical protein Q6360_13070 [Candidatus Brocadiales bacterium]|nr:hypothetical protein [Candidatus Brocadiales bacterium]
MSPEIVFGSITTYAPNTCYTAAATTTESRITVGAGTTTVDCFLGDGGAQATLLTIFHASSTSAVLHIDAEYSTDGINFFPDHLASSTNSARTIAWTFASSTVSQQGVAATPVCFAGAIQEVDCARRAMDIPVQTRYVRVIYTATGATAHIWGQLVPKVDVN